MNEVKVKSQKVNIEYSETVHINTNLLPMFNVGMYESILTPNIEKEQEAVKYNYPQAEYYMFEIEVDWDIYHKVVAQSASEVMEERILPVLKRYGVSDMKVTGISNPKYYNFETDELEFDVMLSNDFETQFYANMEVFKENRSLQKYIEDHYWDHSGFWSWMPKSFKEIEEDPYDVRNLSAYLTFCLLVEGEMEPERVESRDFEIYYKVNGRDYDAYSVEWLVDENLVELYGNDEKLNRLIWDIFYKKGRPWKSFREMYEKNEEADLFIRWASKNHFTVSDLEQMANE